MRTRVIAWFLAALALSVVTAFWWIGHPTDVSLQRLQSPPFAVGDLKTVREDANAKPADHKMSELEFQRLKVGLPTPVNEPWSGPFFDSKSCFDPENKEAAVAVLPTWIRQALLTGKPEMAARYLWTLIKLSEDKEPAVATKGVLAIYRLGDYNGAAVARMRDWIESGFAFRYSDSTIGSSTSMDIRARVLEELDLNNDRSLDQSIYDAWLRNQAAEGKVVAATDYAYYLEKHGRQLPDEYWMQRLDNPYGFERALEIAERKGAPELTAKLQSIFEPLRARPATTPDASRAASIAAALFRQTGDTQYRDYLAEQARTQLASGSFESNLPRVLNGLAATNDKGALEIVSTAMLHENEIVREMAIDALGKSSDPAATELLFQAGIKRAQQGKGFPARELRALLAQGDPSADSKYERLQQVLLSGQLGWAATASDFESLEFFRKHGRQ